MKLSPPTSAVWWIALILVLLGAIFGFGVVTIDYMYSFWMLLIAAVLLLIATRVHNL